MYMGNSREFTILRCCPKSVLMSTKLDSRTGMFANTATKVHEGILRTVHHAEGSARLGQH